MPTGLLIDLNDGGPRMEITSGLRCPSFCQNVAEAWDTNQYTLNQRVAGSQIVVIPRNTVWSGQRGTNLVPTIGMFDGFSVSGNTITLNTWWSDNWGRARSFSSAVWQILPASQGRGLFIQNSTDFLSITDSTMAGYCIWRGTVTVSGIWQTPVTGISRDQYLVFAKWSADGVVVDFDGYTVSAFVERDGEDVPATVTLQIAIFASGVSPSPGTGLNIFNATGACVFSTTKRPFVYRNATYAPSWSWTDIGNTMIMLGRYGYDSSLSGGWDYIKWAGLVRSGNSVRCGKGKVSASWTANYPVTGRRLTALSIPCVDAMY